VTAYPEHVDPELVRLDAASARVVDRFVFGNGMVPGSPQYVPSRSSEAELDRFIVCTVVGAGARRSSSGDELWIFRAGELSKGPVCKLGHPELDFALTLHTTWMSALRPRTASYQIPVMHELETRMAKLPRVWPWSAARKVVRRYAARGTGLSISSPRSRLSSGRTRFAGPPQCRSRSLTPRHRRRLLRALAAAHRRCRTRGFPADSDAGSSA